MGTYIPCSWIKSLNIVKMTMYPKGIYTFNAILTRLPEAFSIDINKLLLSCIQLFRGPRITKIILKRRKKLRVLCHPISRLTVTVIIIDRYKTTEQNRNYSNTFNWFSINVLRWFNRKMTLFSKWGWTTGYPYGTKLNLYTNLIPHIKINSKWIINLNIKTKTILKLLGKNTLKITTILE